MAVTCTMTCILRHSPSKNEPTFSKWSNLCFFNQQVHSRNKIKLINDSHRYRKNPPFEVEQANVGATKNVTKFLKI